MIDAVSYGTALFRLAAERGNDAQVRQELAVIRRVLEDNPSYVTLLDTPAVTTGEKTALLRESFGDCDPMLCNFLCILCEKHSIYRFCACADAFGKAFDEAHGIVRASAITAVPMEQAQQDALVRKLRQLTGKKVELTCSVDPALIGGITLRYGGVQLDDSIRSRLDSLRKSLRDTIV